MFYIILFLLRSLLNGFRKQFRCINVISTHLSTSSRGPSRRVWVLVLSQSRYAILFSQRVRGSKVGLLLTSEEHRRAN